MRDRPESRIDALKQVDDRGQAVFDLPTDRVVLREGCIPGKQCGNREPYPENSGVCLERDRSDEDAAEAEQASGCQRFGNVASQEIRRNHPAVADQAGDHAPARAEIVLVALEVLHRFEISGSSTGPT
jgi:hypothetical protein